jgi:hypothetical protein
MKRPKGKKNPAREKQKNKKKKEKKHTGGGRIFLNKWLLCVF